MIISNYQYFFIENGRKWNIIFYLYHEEIELLILKIVKKDKENYSYSLIANDNEVTGTAKIISEDNKKSKEKNANIIYIF